METERPTILPASEADDSAGFGRCALHNGDLSDQAIAVVARKRVSATRAVCANIPQSQAAGHPDVAPLAVSSARALGRMRVAGWMRHSTISNPLDRSEEAHP